MQIQLIRHATLLLDLGGKCILVDPMLSPAGAMPPIARSGDDRRNPLVPLPVDPAELVATVDAVLLTHLHRDHFDDLAAVLLPKDLPILCQPCDLGQLRERGFRDLRPVEGSVIWKGISVTRTGGRHGTGAVGLLMGTVSGFLIQAPGEPLLYVAGDTVWCSCVRKVLKEHRPDAVVLNAGGARFTHGGAITMTAEHVAQVCRTAAQAQIVAVHMDAINHCGLTREALRSALAGRGLADRVRIPADGDWLGG